MTGKSVPKFVIREARPDDAEQLIAHTRRIAAEPDRNILMEPDEFPYTLEQEREFLQACAENDDRAFFVAEADGQLIGVLNVSCGHRRAVRHEATLGISVRREWRGRGVGTALMSALLAWAKNTGWVRRVQLQVFARNAPAIHLYEKFGFVVEGCHRQAICQNGQYLDKLTMALILD
ncbi:MAG: GNAT family N-acetyltransferase [Anaerolineae bacterium]|nr:GNAT family N-acetyltransferase [Anaerolineae bacterium]